MLQQLVVNGLIAGCVYALVTLGFALIYRTVRFFHFAHGAVVTFGGYAAYTAYIVLGASLWLAFASALLLSGLMGMAIDRAVYRPLRRRKAPNLVFLIASFGVFLFVQSAIQLAYGSSILSLTKGSIVPGHEVLGVVITNTQIAILLSATALATALWFLLRFTSLGVKIRAVADDTLGASVVGINPESVIAASLGIGSALAGVAGVLVGMETNLEPSMGLALILKGIVASIIGGIGSLLGAVAGALLIGLVEAVVAWTVGAQWQDPVVFTVLVSFLLLRPMGVAGLVTGKQRL